MSLLIPETARPTNLHMPEGTTAKVVDGDLFNICERVREISPRLFLVLLEGQGKYSFAIMEKCEDGVDRLVFRVKELDGRVIKKLERLMAQPLAARMKELEEECKRHERESHEEELDKLYENMGRPMWTQLEHDGFTQRGVSYPKRGIKPRQVRGVVGH